MDAVPLPADPATPRPRAQAIDPGLPPPHTRRWVARRKAQIVTAIATGRLTVRDACAIYRLSVEELTCWQRSLDRNGLAGLEATRLKHYRQAWTD